MMKIFRTPVDIPESNFNLTYKKYSCMLGSCFTNYISQKLNYYKLPVLHNPFGMLYNPESIRNALYILMHERYFEEKDLQRYNNLWFSFHHDTGFSGPNRQMVLEDINTGIKQGNQWLKKTDLLGITFGTARVYKHKKKDHVVANCHKIPADKFTRYLMEVDEIVENYKSLIKELKDFNDKLHIVFTISPVRHWKDGAVKNQQSKAVLILAIQKLLMEFPDLEYFPAYEIMMDELRDYRFYADDMIHPGKSGVNYIWERFCDTYIKKSTYKFMGKIEQIVNARNHKPFRPKSLEHQNFLKKQIEKTEQLMDKQPHINLKQELDYFISQLEGNT